MVLTAAVMAWLISGTGEPKAETAPAVSESPVRGVVRPRIQAQISSDLGATVERVPLRDGERFRKGDLLVSFDCRRLEAEYEAAKSAHREAQVTAENSQYLSDRKALGKFDLEISRARMSKAAAEMAAVGVRLSQCTIVAPHDGRVVELYIHEHETPEPGKPVISIIADKDLEIELIVPSVWLVWLQEEAKFRFKIDETQSEHEASVLRLGAAVDPVSQTIKVIGSFALRDAKTLAGMSGTAAFLRDGN